MPASVLPCWRARVIGCWYAVHSTSSARPSIGLGYNVASGLSLGTSASLEDRVKERLTGAAILVALVVVIVPELLRGERSAPAPLAAVRDGAPPLQSFTIELGSAPRSATAAGTTETAEPALTGSAAGAPAPAATPAAAPTPAPISTPASPAAPSKAEPAAAPAAPRPPAAAIRAAAASGWVVQLGSFTRRENATRLVQQAAGKGLRLSVAGPDARGLFRVRSAVQADRSAATALQARLKAAGFNGVISASQ
jgi:DedD protein